MARRQAVRRTPRQERSRQLVEAVREACRQVLAEHGHEGLTTARIAERAGVSVGSLYQYFENKEQILSDLFREALDEQLGEAADWGEVLREMPLHDQLRIGLRHALANYRRMLEIDAPYFRSHHTSLQMELEFPLPATLPQASDPAEAGAVAFTLGNLERNRDQLRPERLERLDHAAFLIGRGVPAILRAVVEDDPALLDDPGFQEELLDMMVAYLMRGERE